MFIPTLITLSSEMEISANHSQLVHIQNSLEKWLCLAQSRPDLLGSEEFQDFLNLSQPGVVEVRISKHVLHKFHIANLIVLHSNK